MSYSIEQFILDSGITRAEVDEAKARMLERMHIYGPIIDNQRKDR